jgi:hypothetical protein
LNAPTLKPFGVRRELFAQSLRDEIAAHRILFMTWIEAVTVYRSATNRMEKLSAQCYALKLQAQMDSSSESLLGLSIAMESVGLGEMALEAVTLLQDDILAELKARSEARR